MPRIRAAAEPSRSTLTAARPSHQPCECSRAAISPAARPSWGQAGARRFFGLEAFSPNSARRWRSQRRQLGRTRRGARPAAPQPAPPRAHAPPPWVRVSECKVSVWTRVRGRATGCAAVSAAVSHGRAQPRAASRGLAALPHSRAGLPRNRAAPDCHAATQPTRDRHCVSIGVSSGFPLPRRVRRADGASLRLVRAARIQVGLGESGKFFHYSASQSICQSIIGPGPSRWKREF